MVTMDGKMTAVFESDESSLCLPAGKAALSFSLRPLFNLYLFLLIFNTTNKAFQPVIDLRWVIFALSSVLLILKLLQKIRYPVTKRGDFQFFLVFSLLVFFISLGNLNWPDSKYFFKPGVFRNFTILLYSAMMNILTILAYRKYADMRFFYKCFRFSIVFLLTSVLLEFCGVNIYRFSAYSELGRTANTDREMAVIGLFRSAGFAWDPNYAALYLTIFLLIALHVHKRHRFLYVLFSLPFFVMMASKTLLAAQLLLLLAYVLKVRHKIIFSGSVIAASALIIFTCFRYLVDSLRTVLFRYQMAESALKAFLENPLVGNGFTSARGAHEYYHDWYVTLHSTYFTLLAENGLLGYLAYLAFLFYCYRYTNYDRLVQVVLCVLLIAQITYEYHYQNVVPVFIVALALAVKNGQSQAQPAL